jgi:SAM-dependent methyltransferase
VLEIGCGPGWNLTALKSLFPTATLTGVEPNAVARQKAVAAGLTVVDGALPSPLPAGTFDLVLCCNVLGHLIPAQLDAGLTAVRGKVATNRWLLVIEYNTERADRADEACEWPTAGVVDVLWRRDFGAHFGRLYPSRTVLATGMVYKAADAMPDASTFWMMRF